MRSGQKIGLLLSRPRVLDVTLVVLLCLPSLIALPLTLGYGDARTAAGAGLFLLAVPPLLARRRHPVPVAVAAAAIDILGRLTVTTSVSLIATIALYGLGRHAATRRALLATLGPMTLAYAAVSVATGMSLLGALFPPVVTGAGLLMRSRAEARDLRQDMRTEEAVQAERRRIARELHDVVAHHITVVSALVGGARVSLPAGTSAAGSEAGSGAGSEAAEALLAAERSARQALTEMRHLLRVLRADGTESGGGEATGVGTVELPALVEQAGAAGPPAELVVEGEPVPLPAAVDRAVYRIVQEALTNTRKHAPGSRSSVRISYGSQEVEVEVLDDGAVGAVAVPASPGGFGLVGMAERVALCGGSLDTGPGPGGGFRVHARLPL
ncbi:sensor histidine kinase [Streptosporangium saharense]|uniref:histidine kinase n=1 Tax=Streptosporangium saharense TaxID=1706840 RepID=A0A7W7QS41_9ACTN|nr:histidine kinase [Streptosporangium saharense]MBB4918161.1 signal transduction histidine kinase [Streptosporangium saharense]